MFTDRSRMTFRFIARRHCDIVDEKFALDERREEGGGSRFETTETCAESPTSTPMPACVTEASISRNTARTLEQAREDADVEQRTRHKCTGTNTGTRTGAK
eukprot:2663599-Rhodomonas_salina.2